MPHAYFGAPIPHLAAGIRLPDIVAPVVLKAFKETYSTGSLMLSYHRETGTTAIVEGEASLLRGHTGTSIMEYVSKAIEYSDLYNVPVQIEADHVSISPSPERAIKRISKGGYEYGVTEEEIRESLAYIDEELKEAKKAGGIDSLTIDTCELINYEADKLGASEIESLYQDLLGEEARVVESLYLPRPHRILDPKGRLVTVKLTREALMRLVVKYWRSLEYLKRIYDMAKSYFPVVGVEITIDETPYITRPEELFFYLSEALRRGIPVDYVAPNIGFEKREDYVGDLSTLKERLSTLSSIANSMGAMISIHSGSGHNPYSDKGVGVWSTVREATYGKVRYKVSGVYIQLLLEVMSRFPEGSRPRRLYEEIFDLVLNTLEEHVSKKQGLYSPSLERMIEEYRAGRWRPRDPRADFFRHYFFLFQALRDESGVRMLREEILDLYSRDWDLRRQYEREAIEMTARLIKSLGFSGNLFIVRGATGDG